MVRNRATPLNRQPQAHEADTASETLVYRVLVGTPKTYWIPIFALGVESTVLTSVRALWQAVGAKAASGLRGGRYGAYQLVQVRSRSGRTATYSTWLDFSETEHANAFVTDYPDMTTALR